MISPNKRYQVFISSTFTDLKEERAEVTQAILELGHMPYGMEAFPAANETQWEWIKKAIEESDYYIVIIGGKYGSVNSKTEISYTEMEYRYADEKGIPSIAFIIDDSVDLPKSKIETDQEKVDKLLSFKKYIDSNKLRKSYTSKEDLKAKLYPSFLQLIRQCPREGWIKANSLKEYTPNSEVLKLVKENQSLKNSSELVQGEESLLIEYRITIDNWGFTQETYKEDSIVLSWDIVFFSIAETMYLNGRIDYSSLKRTIESHIYKMIQNTLPPEKDSRYAVRVNDDFIQDYLLQFEALGYITTYNAYWELTKKGRKHYIAHKAIKKSGTE
ncbi:MAG: DUF4062 domain-containing protein [Paludibacter sp.]|nr:DUF4062 domain-containing protein [Paludibacter sp.]